MAASVREVLRSPGQPLDAASRAFFEPRFGHDLSQVRVHADAKAAESARLLGADAYSTGRSIVFGHERYAPHTRVGRQLLMHEAAHLAHQASAGSLRPGVAPADSLAERRAESLATSENFSAPARSKGVAPFSLRDWGPAWEIHRQRITSRGAVQHTGRVGPEAPVQGPPVGSVEVRTGEEIEIPARGGTPAHRIPNLIAIEYTGAISPDSRWLQFVWFEMAATTPIGTVMLSGSVPTTSGTKPFTTTPASPNWTVDSGSTSNPYYEAVGLNIRNSSSTAMFDAPGGSSAAPLAAAAFRAGIGATSVVFRAHFATYLIQRNFATYLVSWSASTAFTLSGSSMTVGGIGYSVGTSRNVGGLPTDLRTILHAGYPGSTSIT